MIPSVLQDIASQLKHGVHVRAAQVEVTIVESDIKAHIHLISHTDWKRRFGKTQNLAGCDIDFVFSWRFRFPFCDLGRTLLGHNSSDLNG